MTAKVIAFPTIYSPPPRGTGVEFPKPIEIVRRIERITVGTMEDPRCWGRTMRLLITVLPDVDSSNGVVMPVDTHACHTALSELSFEFSQCCFGPGAHLLRMVASIEEGENRVLITALFEVPEHASTHDLARLTQQAFAGLIDENGDDIGLPGLVVMDRVSTGEILHMLSRVVTSHSETSH